MPDWLWEGASLITQAPPCGATSVAHLPEQPRQSLLHAPLAPAPEATPCLDSPLLVAPSAPSVVPPAVVAPSLPHLPPRSELVAHTPANAVALVVLALGGCSGKCATLVAPQGGA